TIAQTAPKMNFILRSNMTFGAKIQGLADNAVVAKVNGEVYDLDRVLESDCTIKFLKFDDPEGGDDPEHLFQFKREATEIMESGGFRLHKWHSNVPEAEENDLGEHANQGVPWNKSKDELTISFGGNTESQPLTKRKMLATINRIYDILGLASPVTVVGKILYSKVCISEKRWDEEITDPEILREWTKWLKGMGECTTVSVPRSVVDQEVTRLVLHGFSDSSKAAVSAAVYVVAYHAERPIKQTLLVAKSRVAPKNQSIPRLELVAAHTLTKLMSHVKEILQEQPVAEFHCWVDSTTVLYWIKGKGTWSQFVRNRTKFIQEKDYLQWHYVPTGQNPSDIGSRGAAPKELSDVWLQGPDWMADKEKWPPQPEITVSDEKAKTQHQEKQLMAKEEPKKQGVLDALLDKYSSCWKLQRVVALVQRFLNNCRSGEKRTGPLSTEEVAGARSMLIRHAQSSTEKLSERLSELKKGDDGMLRCEGRVPGYNPVFLPRDHKLVTLLIQQVHEQTLHGEVAITMCQMREKYWVPKMRALVKKMMVSDNGKTFIATGKWLSVLKKDHNLASYLATQSIIWKFNLARAPWWGGFFERLVGVMKNMLSKSVGRRLLSYDELQDVILDVETTMNNRPLVYQGEEFTEPVITPNILIRGKPVPVLEEDLDKFSDDDHVSRRMKFLQASKEDLRKRFVREYVHALEERQQSKGADDRYRVPEIGRVVMLKLFLRFSVFGRGSAVFWHSSAHILGEAMERHYGGCLCYGPPIEEGYFYDMYLDGRQVSSNDFPSLDTLTKSIVKEKQPFERLEMKKEDLLEMFKYNEFKCRILNEKVKTPTTTVYRCGPLIDLCRGPHVRHTGKIKAISVTKNSATYWEGNCEAESLQRIYGISFPNDKQLKEWKKFQEEAAKRDHRKLGREEYQKRGFQEVVSPNIYSTKLWETSGHWQHYSEHMFSFEVEKQRYALKPMNCPGHCLMFDHRPRSWRELPLRMADFGVLHRNELSGTLSGLTRVRRFQQDDAHIFCTSDQVALKEAYSVHDSDRVGIHKEASTKRLARDEDDVQKLVNYFTSGMMTSPFTHDSDSLVNFATGVVLPTEVANSLVNCTEKGHEQMSTFIEKRLDSNDVNFWDPISNLKIKTFDTVSKRIQINLKEVLGYELSSIPYALAHAVRLDDSSES
ncbi:hypothetical protein QZH41_015885, partial [Actinostola sp. cb2023]